jgi:cytochrome c-type biogenesis protein CcmE
MTRKGKRLVLIFGALAALGLALALVLVALRENIVFFRTPTEVAEKQLPAGTRLRIGGLVKPGSFIKGASGEAHFTVTDNAHDVAVSYVGLLPDLFREGQGVVAEGVIAPDSGFRADNVLAKHDERYMPREVADALKKQGVWQGEKK